MIFTPVFPPGSDGPEPIDLEAPDARDRLAELYRPPSDNWLRLNLIGSVSGSATGADGTSETLTNPADRVLLGVIRSLADVVLVGAASVRAEGYFVPRRAALAVVTASGDLTGHQITSTGQRGPLIVVCPAGVAELARDTIGDPNARILAVDIVGPELTADEIVAALHSEGLHSIVSEGGPKLAAHLLHGEVIDEVCLSTSPVLNGANIPLFGASEFVGRPLQLAGLMVDSASGVYARWRL